MNAPIRLRQLDNCLSVPPVAAIAVMPDMAWVEFLRGDLSDADWALIARVENGELTTGEALGLRGERRAA